MGGLFFTSWLHSRRYSSRDTLGSLKAVKKKVFVDERWSQSRIVTAMDWSSYVSNNLSPSHDWK